MTKINMLKADIAQAGCLFLSDEPMKKHTSFRIGGPAEVFALPADEKQAAAVIASCRRHEVKYYLVGNGSNLLVADEGLKGVVIAFSQPMSGVARNDASVLAQSGVTLAQLCRFACREGLCGLEFAFGIPGSVGGAVCMNAGAYGGEMKNVVATVRVLDQSGFFYDIPAAEAGFGYRDSVFQKNGAVICSATFLLKKGDPREIETRMRDVLSRRIDKQPMEWPSAGSAFKRPKEGYAAALIDSCGLKGLAIGDAQVSEKHAGFIINRGSASCKDILALLETVKNAVYKEFGIMLEPEIKHLV